MKKLIPCSFREGTIRAIQRIAALLISGGRVSSGPFKGMRYISSSYMSAYYPKILGSYEMELWKTLEEIVEQQPAQILNIGAAEGYYAVGLAKRLPETEIFTYELNPYAQSLLNELANINDVEDRIKIGGACSLEVLKEILENLDQPILIMDIEGGEDMLLDIQNISKLKKCQILLEVHENENPILPQKIKDRFCESHICYEIKAETRKMSDLPINLPQFLSDTVIGRSLKLMMNEQRTDGKIWFHLKPIT